MRLELDSFKTNSFPARSLDSFQPRGGRGANGYSPLRLPGFDLVRDVGVAREGIGSALRPPDFSYET
jgi:hypothetical protein